MTIAIYVQTYVFHIIPTLRCCVFFVVHVLILNIRISRLYILLFPCISLEPYHTYIYRVNVYRCIPTPNRDRVRPIPVARPCVCACRSSIRRRSPTSISCNFAPSPRTLKSHSESIKVRACLCFVTIREEFPDRN